MGVGTINIAQAETPPWGKYLATDLATDLCFFDGSWFLKPYEWRASEMI